MRHSAKSPFVLFCDHASNRIPPELDNLGLPASELQRHIAWDIGAAAVTGLLSEILDAPAILCETSRLVIDCNRQLHARDLIPEVSDGTVIPGNLGLSAEARQGRIETWFEPYHAAVESVIESREPAIAISIHSMTPSLAGSERPWQIALSSELDRRLTEPMLAALRQSGDIVVGDNQPYDLDGNVDYSTPYHAIRRQMLYLQVEFRQDEITSPAGQAHWARRFAAALNSITRT